MAPQKNFTLVSFVYCTAILLSSNELVAQLDDYKKLTAFTKMRVWESVQGTKLTGKLVSLDSGDGLEIVVSDKPERIKLRLEQLSKKDQDFIARFRDKALEDTKSDSRKLGTAEEVRDLYQKLSFDGLVPRKSRENFQALLELLNRHAAANSISIPGEFIKPKELKARKEEARQLIDTWISESNKYYKGLKEGEKLETELVKSAIKKDPTSVEGIVLLSLLFGLKESELRAEMRRLEDAIEAGQRYGGIASDHERFNIAAAYNNLAVNCCRQGQVNKALRHWENAADFANGEIKKTVGENLVRLENLAQSTSKVREKFTGLAATERELARLDKLLKIYAPQDTTGGWKLIVPKDVEGRVRTNMPFILAPRTTFMGQVIGDTRCLHCFGSTLVSCPNKPCTRGRIKIPLTRPRYITMANGSRKYVGEAPAGFRFDPCPVCRGHEKGLVKCPTCNGSGAQK